ncbi:MAG: ComF family protein [Gemmataceae bacterium]
MAFDAAVRLGVYDEHLKWAILRIKNASQEGLAETLGEMLGSTHQTRLISFKPDLIVPIPLHWRKRLGRGYNQSQALARGLGFLLGISPSPSCLKRLRHTPEQHLTTSTTARKKNVQGAFFASARVAGRRVLLVDDVMTTGATAHEAARALKKQGATEVFLAIIARTRG